jgi:hypothetical protein
MRNQREAPDGSVEMMCPELGTRPQRIDEWPARDRRHRSHWLPAPRRVETLQCFLDLDYLTGASEPADERQPAEATASENAQRRLGFRGRWLARHTGPKSMASHTGR